jgi:O-antigen/teichoic acid export membrane protein
MNHIVSQVVDWLRPQRTSVRLAFLLRTVSMVVGSLAGLVWTRVLLNSMGEQSFGLLLSILAVIQLVAAGDQNIGAAIALRVGQSLGSNEPAPLQSLLAAARGLYLALAICVSGLLLLVAPLLPSWLGFEAGPETRPIALAFAVGSAVVAFRICGSYFQSLNFAYGTITWPIFPALISGQLILPCLQLLLIFSGAPIWMLLLPYALIAGLDGWLARCMLKWSHPWLGVLRPISADLRTWASLISEGGWFYLYTLGSTIYHVTDRLLVNAGFGAAKVPSYQLNYKLCELALSLIYAASLASLPKITQWLASSKPDDAARARMEVQRLREFQTILGVALGLGYILTNDMFVRLWFGETAVAPLALQYAFALNLVVTACGDAGVQLVARCGRGGLIFGALAVGGTGLLNLVLSWLAMRNGSFVGIAVATVIAQVLLVGSCGWKTCRALGYSPVTWMRSSLLVPAGIVGLAILIRERVPMTSPQSTLILAIAFIGLLVLCFFGSGASIQRVMSEFQTLRGMLRRRSAP